MLDRLVNDGVDERLDYKRMLAAKWFEERKITDKHILDILLIGCKKNIYHSRLNDILASQERFLEEYLERT